MAQGLGNNFPMPEGEAHVSFTNLQAGATTSNFTWGEAGLYTIALNLEDPALPMDKVSLQKVSGGVTTNVFDMLEPGYFDTVLPPGGGTYNFTTVNPVSRVSMTKRSRFT